MTPALPLLALLAVAPALASASGYGRFGWGESAAACRQKEPRLRPRPDAEPVELERTTLTLAHEEDEQRARAAGAEALALWKKTAKKPATRLTAEAAWVEIGGQPGRVTLLFIDDKLYGAEVGVLEKSREAGDQIEALLRQKYGLPRKARGAETPEAARAGAFDTPDGTVEFFRQPAAGGDGGILRLTYRSLTFGSMADGHVETLRGRRMRLDEARQAAAEARDAARDEERAASILQHL